MVRRLIAVLLLASFALDTKAGESPITMEDPDPKNAENPETEEPPQVVKLEKPKTKTVLSNSAPAPEPEDEVLLGLPVHEPHTDDYEFQGAKVLNGDTFGLMVASGYTFVKFYAPWCGHCQEMAAEFDQLADFFRENPVPGVALTIAEVDCTAGMDGSMGACMKEGVHGYPTIKLYNEGDVVQEYQYARSFDRMKKFLHKELFDISRLEPNSLGVFELNDVSFQMFLDSSANTPVIVLFHVPWCHHCKELRGVWEELAITFLMEEAEDVKFVDVNCMEALDVCTEEGIEGFPQIYMYKDGMMEDVFEGERSLMNIANFVWQEVDRSRVEEDDSVLDLMMAMQGMGGQQATEEGDEEEECDCSEPDCDCGEDEMEEEDEDEDEEEDWQGEDEDEELSEEEIKHLEKMIKMNKEKKASGEPTEERPVDEKVHEEL